MEEKPRYTSRKILRFVIWICRKFIRSEIEQLIEELKIVLQDKNPSAKPKDDFKQKHPNYRNFNVDPMPPVTEPPPEPGPKFDYKILLKQYKQEHGRALRPVKKRKQTLQVDCNCPNCGAPEEYMYWNDGKKRTQYKCKICNELFQIKKSLNNPHLRYTVVHIAD